MSTADETVLAAATAQIVAMAALVGSDADDAGDPTGFGYLKQIDANTVAPESPENGLTLGAEPLTLGAETLTLGA